MKNIIIILISILSLSVKGQNIPVKYQGQYVITRQFINSCGGNFSAKPFQMFEMNEDEKKIYNELVSLKKGFTTSDGIKYVYFIQGVIKQGEQIIVIYTFTKPGFENSNIMTRSQFIEY